MCCNMWRAQCVWIMETDVDSGAPDRSGLITVESGAMWNLLTGSPLNTEIDVIMEKRGREGKFRGALSPGNRGMDYLTRPHLGPHVRWSAVHSSSFSCWFRSPLALLLSCSWAQCPRAPGPGWIAPWCDVILPLCGKQSALLQCS